jgi:EAL domain-containing protein (putative c-di-GMP-specific phosphodiesterase class I)
LLRWKDPVRGMVSPAEFIPHAERTGFILPLGAWVLNEACARLAIWKTQPDFEHLKLSVNVSAYQLRQPDFVEVVKTALEHSGAPPNRLKLELTESMLVKDVEDLIAKMEALAQIGVGFSLDDFGTGYSSLSYLKRLPLRQLKIDQAFVRDVETNKNAAAIAKTLISLGHTLGLTVVAEGVETRQQHAFLQSLGCSVFQGFLFSRPVDVASFEAVALQKRVA